MYLRGMGAEWMRMQGADSRRMAAMVRQPCRITTRAREWRDATPGVYLKFGSSKAGSCYINKSVTVFPNSCSVPPSTPCTMDHHYTHSPFVAALSRTASEETVCINNVNPTTSRRTRKRFTNVQLMMLENLFHQNSHPSREDREAVAKAGGM